MKKLTTEEVVKRFKTVHGDRYDYSKVDYIGAKSKIVIICPIHGEFYTILDKHINGTNCNKCVCDRYHLDYKKSTEGFISDAKKFHGDRYDYSLVDYINNKTKVNIICPKHGVFKQRADSHRIGNGCPMCKESVGEREIRLLLESNGIDFEPQHRFDDCVMFKPLPFDFYLPAYNICIEFNGRQHYEHNHFFVSKKGFDELKKRDQIKKEYCYNNNISLIVIRYDENIKFALEDLLQRY
jgi:hypothetical protein